MWIRKYLKSIKILLKNYMIYIKKFMIEILQNFLSIEIE